MCVVAAAFLTSCGKPSAEDLAEQTMVKMEEVASILEGVEDVDTAKAAAEKIKGITGEIAEIKKAADEIKGSDEEAKKFEAEMMKKYEDRTKKMTEKITKSMMGLATKPEAMKIIGDAMAEMGKAAQ